MSSVPSPPSPRDTLEKAGVLDKYVEEVRLQCTQARLALASFDAAWAKLWAAIRQDMEADPFQRDPARRQRTFDDRADVFRAFHDFLNHASNVSKLFWPPDVPEREAGEDCEAFDARMARHYRKKPHKIPVAIVGDERRCTLQAALGVGVTDWILKDRGLRNDLEHFDERMDQWVADGATAPVASDSIGQGMAAMPFLQKMVTWRLVDPAAGVYVLGGKHYKLGDLAVALGSVEDRAKNWLARTAAEREAAQKADAAEQAEEATHEEERETP